MDQQFLFSVFRSNINKTLSIIKQRIIRKIQAEHSAVHLLKASITMTQRISTAHIIHGMYHMLIGTTNSSIFFRFQRKKNRKHFNSHEIIIAMDTGAMMYFSKTISYSLPVSFQKLQHSKKRWTLLS